MSIILVGLNSRTAPFALRERLALSGKALDAALTELHDCPGSPLQEVVILSTCNRLEIYAESTGSTWTVLQQFIARLGDLSLEALRPHLYFLENDAAVSHLMRVAAGLESVIFGETQVLGQVGQALAAAQAADTCGAVLTRLFTQAVHAGKRAHSETAISRETTSLSHTAARLAREFCARENIGDPARVLIVGAGEMAALAAQALSDQDITVINRTYAHAAALAHQVGGQALPWTQT